jgi:hypothetical protein
LLLLGSLPILERLLGPARPMLVSYKRIVVVEVRGCLSGAREQ